MQVGKQGSLPTLDYRWQPIEIASRQKCKYVHLELGNWKKSPSSCPASEHLQEENACPFLMIRGLAQGLCKADKKNKGARNHTKLTRIQEEKKISQRPEQASHVFMKAGKPLTFEEEEAEAALEHNWCFLVFCPVEN